MGCTVPRLAWDQATNTNTAEGLSVRDPLHYMFEARLAALIWIHRYVFQNVGICSNVVKRLASDNPEV